MMYEREAIAILTAVQHDDYETADAIAKEVPDPLDLLFMLAGITLGLVQRQARIEATSPEELLQSYGRQAAERARIADEVRQLGMEG